MINKLTERPYISYFKVITKPFASFDLIREKGYGSIWQIAIPVLLLFLVRVFQIVFSGFLFNTVDVSKINLLIEFVTIIFIYLLFVFANKNFCDLIDGDGNMVEVALVTSSALIPYIMASTVNIFLSNFFVTREASFMTIITTVGLIWSAFVGFVGLKTIHRYTFTKTVLTFVITVVFMLLIAFLLAIVFLIGQQLYIFFKDIYNEIIFRI